MGEHNCAVYVRVQLRAPFLLSDEHLPENVGRLIVSDLSNRAAILTGSKDSMQSRIRDVVAEMTDSIALDILRARDAYGPEN